MNDLVYFFAAPGAIGVFALLYMWTKKTWNSLSTEEINAIWNSNMEKFGTVEQFARDIEAELQRRNP